MSRTLSSVRAVVRQLLRDEFDVDTTQIWANDEIDILIGECLVDISLAAPNMVKEVLTTIANSKELDISSIDDLLSIDKAEYPTGSDPRDYRKVLPIDNETIEIVTDTTPSAGGSGTLTGTVTFASGSAAITGSGTAFTTELAAGYHIKKSTGTRWYRIYSIESATALTLAEASHDTGTDAGDATEYCYETAYLYCRKVHQLTETASTLSPIHEYLVALGTVAKASMNLSRDKIDGVNKGGAGTAREMMSWGATQHALFKEELRKIIKPITSRRYPRG
ncbi:hypothetical protein ES703_69747 [subsurface metagenome]